MTERGSMLPLFIGLGAVSLCFALGASEVCGQFVLREQAQQLADQIALKASSAKLSEDQMAALLPSRFKLLSARFTDGQTAEAQVCVDWKSWIRLPGLDTNTSICASAAAR